MAGLRVALIHNFHARATPSGEDAVVVAEAAALRRAGVDVRIMGASNDEMERRPFKTARAATAVATGIGVSPLRELRSFRPDIVHIHGLFPYLGRGWLRRIEVPIVATSHNYRAVCANGFLFRAGSVCTLCLDGRPWSGVRYGCYRHSRVASLPHAIATARGAARDTVLTAAHRVLVLSERARSILIRAGVPDERLVLDHHFLPDDLDTGEPDTRDDPWLFVGRLTPEKGIDRLISLWPADEPLRIIGDGDLRPTLEQAAAGKAIQFVGQVSRNAVMDLVRTSFGLVFPSRWYETFGLVYIEALAGGVPTLAFKPNVVADAVARDRTGIVGSWSSLDRSLKAARHQFDTLRHRCRVVFEERYTEKNFVDRRLALYSGLLS